MSGATAAPVTMAERVSGRLREEFRVNEGVRSQPIRGHTLMRWVIVYGAMFLIAGLFGSVPVFVSNRRFMDT